MLLRMKKSVRRVSSRKSLDRGFLNNINWKLFWILLILVIIVVAVFVTFNFNRNVSGNVLSSTTSCVQGDLGCYRWDHNKDNYYITGYGAGTNGTSYYDNGGNDTFSCSSTNLATACQTKTEGDTIGADINNLGGRKECVNGTSESVTVLKGGVWDGSKCVLVQPLFINDLVNIGELRNNEDSLNGHTSIGHQTYWSFDAIDGTTWENPSYWFDYGRLDYKSADLKYTDYLPTSNNKPLIFVIGHKYTFGGDIFDIQYKESSSSTINTKKIVIPPIGSPSKICDVYLHVSQDGSTYYAVENIGIYTSDIDRYCIDYSVNPKVNFISSLSKLAAKCVDQDGDGSYPKSSTCPINFGNDCNDHNAAIKPGAIDVCGDGIDNNCDGRIDETKNACGTCGPAPIEKCDGIDNDCDKQIDEGFNLGGVCYSGVGACKRSARYQCNPDGTSSCNAVAGTPTTTNDVTCDGIDSDCDGCTECPITLQNGTRINSC